MLKRWQVLLIALPLLGAAIAPSIDQELIDDFSGGLNTVLPSHKLDKKYSPYMQNVFIDNGKIERINGYVALGSSATLSKVTGIFPFVRESGQTTFLVTDSSVTLETSDFSTWVLVSSASNTGSLLNWIQVRNKMWGFNGVDFVQTWDGTSKVILNGSNGTPNVPKFRYGAYYQDRVWGFGAPNAASDLYFSAVITTDNVVIAPDNQFAWPSINVVPVGRGDGQIGTALWIYQGQLRAGKEHSIYTIYGDNSSDYKARKEEANIGVVSNDSVRVLDGQSHFLGQTGVYRNIERVSDLIQPDITRINKGVTNIVTDSWDSQAEFSRGQFSGTTATLSGLLTVSTEPFYMNRSTYPTPASYAANNNPHISLSNPGLSLYDYRVRLSTETVPLNFFGYPTSLTLVSRGTPGGCSPNVKITIKNNRTGETTDFTRMPVDTNFNEITYNFSVPVLFTSSDLSGSQFQIRIEATSGLDSGCSYDFYTSTFTGFSTIKLLAATTGQFISDVSTMNTITAWGNFDSARNTNGGAISYYYRTSTSVINITTQTWQGISPGVVINAPTINKYIQWASTIQSVADPHSNVDNVTISHIEGQATDARAFAMDWLNRYWLTVTTTSDPTLRLTYVKSKITNTNPDAWMPIVGLPINCYAKAGNVLYGGAVTGGTVYRLDYGTNFNGSPIVSIYDTPDLPLGDYFFDKNILKYLIDGTKSGGGVMTIGTSRDEGDFSYSTFSIAGSGRYSREITGVTRKAKTIRLRLQNGETDIGLGINNVNILYEPAKSLSNK